MTAGVLFGIVPGTILVSGAATAAATIAFLIARYAARDKVISAVDSYVAELDKLSHIVTSCMGTGIDTILVEPILHVQSDTGGSLLCLSCRPSVTVHFILCRFQCHACKHFAVCQACTSSVAIQNHAACLPKFVWCSHRYCSWRKTIQSTRQLTEQ